MSYLGEYLKNKRKEKKISQNKLAEKIGWQNGQLVSTYERGVCYPPVGAIKKIAKLVGASKGDVVRYWMMDMESKIHEEMR